MLSPHTQNMKSGIYMTNWKNLNRIPDQIRYGRFYAEIELPKLLKEKEKI
jgi:hypothetical protein